jgi:hypothetical protein
MKYYSSIFLPVIVPFFLSNTIRQEGKPKLAKTFQTVSNANDVLKDGNLSVYEVRFTYTGYVSLSGDSPDCPVGSGGKVTLTGLLNGAENVPANDDVYYEGTLKMDMNIGICSSKRQANGEDVLCNITVGGRGEVKTTLEIYSGGRGGYIQIKDTTSRGFIKNVGGTCDPEQTDEERKMVPLKSIASVFNGLELPVLSIVRTLGELEVNKKYEDPMGNGKVVVEVLRVVKP